MRVCPECGYRQSECWRNQKNQLHVEYCHIEELETFEPELAAEIRDKKPTSRLPLVKELFVYKITRSGHVKRLDRETYLLYGFHGRVTESYKRAQRLAGSDKQTRLSELEELLQEVSNQ